VMTQEDILAAIRDRAAKIPVPWRRWLPYVGLILILSMVWVVWDGPDQGTSQAGPGQGAAVRTGPAVRHSADGAVGQVVYSGAASRRFRPLPDLFAKAVSTKKPLPTSPGSAEAAKPGATVPVQPVAQPVQVVGSITAEGSQLVILQQGNQTQACAVGDTFAGYRVAYISPVAVGVEQGGQITEIALQKGNYHVH
jgi:hypothetical protein